MTNPSDIRIAFVTVPGDDVAKNLAQSLLNAKLVACVNILPEIQSMYHWQGKLETSSEYLLLLKTTANLEHEVIALVAELHPYDLPEVIFLPLCNGLPAYLQWVVSETKNQ